MTSSQILLILFARVSQAAKSTESCSEVSVVRRRRRRRRQVSALCKPVGTLESPLPRQPHHKAIC